MWRSLLLVVAVAPLTACVTLSNTARSYITAPNGLQVDDDRVRGMLHRGMADSALRAVGNRKSPLSPDDRLLRLLYQGTAARYAGKGREAGAFFDQAYAVSEDRYTKSVTRTATALVTNDYALPYTAGRNERLLVHYNALLAWSAAGDADGRRRGGRAGWWRCWRRSGVRRPTSAQRVPCCRPWPLPRSRRTATGTTPWSRVATPSHSARRSTAPSPRRPTRLVTCWWWSSVGDVAHKVAVGLTVPIFSADNANSSGPGFAAERLLGDFAMLRNGGVWYDDTPSWRFDGTRYAPWRGARASYLLDLSWPVLHRAPFTGVGPVSVVAGNGMTADADVTASLSDAIAADYRRDRSALMSRALSRAVTKYLAARAGGGGGRGGREGRLRRQEEEGEGRWRAGRWHGGADVCECGPAVCWSGPTPARGRCCPAAWRWCA